MKHPVTEVNEGLPSSYLYVQQTKIGGSATVQTYITYCRAQGMRPATIRLRCHWLNRASRDLPLATATTGDLIAWLGSHEWAPETRKSARAALRSFYDWMTFVGVRDDNPAQLLRPVRVPAGKPRPTPTGILQAALDGATDRDRLMLALAAFAGLRRSEIAGLQWTDITGAMLRIRGKGGAVRHVPISPALADLLDAEAARRDAGQLGTGWRYRAAWKLTAPHVFPGRWDGHASPETVGAVLAARLGSGWSGHTLRHRFATCAYSVQRDLLTVQRLLGHAKPETTARYAEPPHDAALAAVMGAAA